MFPFVKEFKIERPQKFGGNVEYAHYKELEEDFAAGKLHPMDLKNGLAEALIAILSPARKHLTSEKYKKLKAEFEGLKVTR